MPKLFDDSFPIDQGRTPGTPNKVTIEVRSLMDWEHVDGRKETTKAKPRLFSADRILR